MLRLKFSKHPEVPDAIQVDVWLRDGLKTTVATVAVIRKKKKLWQETGGALPAMTRTKGTIWQVEMLPPTDGAGFDPDVFEKTSMSAAKREIAARMFISIVGCRDAEGRGF